MTSILGGTTIIKEHSRLWGYLSGKPGDSMRPEGLVKFREQSEPEAETDVMNNTDHTVTGSGQVDSKIFISLVNLSYPSVVLINAANCCGAAQARRMSVDEA